MASKSRPGSRSLPASAAAIEPRLGCEVSPLMRVERAVDGIAAGLDRGQHRGGGDAAGVVGVEVHRQPDLLLERLHQLARGARLAHAGHVLDGEDVGAGLLQLLGEVDVVLEVVLGPRGVEDVAGVADRRLAQRAGFDHGVHRHAHVVHPVERVEDAEDVDALLGCLLRRSSARRCRSSWCSRRRWRRAAASGTARWARRRAGATGAPTGLP